MQIEWSQQHRHRTAKHHRGLTDEAMGLKPVETNRGLKGWVAQTLPRSRVELLPFAVDHQPLGMGVKGSHGAGQGADGVQIIGIQPADQGAAHLAQGPVESCGRPLIRFDQKLQPWVFSGQASQDLDAAITGAPVCHQQLQTIGLLQDGGHGLMQIRPWVQAGHQHRDRRLHRDCCHRDEGQAWPNGQWRPNQAAQPGCGRATGVATTRARLVSRDRRLIRLA